MLCLWGYRNNVESCYVNYICWGARFLPSQSPTALLTIALILWLDYYPIDGISNLDSLLEVTITPLCVLLTMERSIRFILEKIQVAIKHHPITRSGLERNTWNWYCVSTCSVRGHLHSYPWMAWQPSRATLACLLVILKHTSLAPILLTLTLEDIYNVKYPSRSLILISEDSPGVLRPVALTKPVYQMHPTFQIPHSSPCVLY